MPPAYCKPFDRVLAGYDDKFCYTAYSKVLPKANSIQCYFPAKDQLFCGVYKLVVVAEMYERVGVRQIFIHIQWIMVRYLCS